MNATANPSSKPKQRIRKGKQRDVSFEATGATPAQVEDAPQKSKPRKRGDNQRQRDSTVTQTTQSEVDPQPHPAKPSKGSRPRARRINKEAAQTSLNPELQSQNDNQLQPAVPEPAACDTIGSPYASPSEAQDTTDGPSGAAPLPPRKRRHTATQDEPNSGNKKRKTLDQHRAKATKEKPGSLSVDIVAEGNVI